jgi:ferritin
MVSKKVIKLLNDQVKLEADSSQVYLAMAVWADANAFRGTASFMYKQAEEERGHMHKIIRFINELTEEAVIGGVEEPKAAYKDIEDVFKTALAHEEKVTASINRIMTEARSANDYPVTSFLKWFIDEQVEEEATVKQVLDIIRMAGKVSVYLADKEIGALVASK